MCQIGDLENKGSILMEPALKTGLSINKKRYRGNDLEIRNHENPVRVANSLIDTILVCLNAHIYGLSALSLDDTVQSIVHEIGNYKEQGILKRRALRRS